MNQSLALAASSVHEPTPSPRLGEWSDSETTESSAINPNIKDAEAKESPNNKVTHPHLSRVPPGGSSAVRRLNAISTATAEKDANQQRSLVPASAATVVVAANANHVPLTDEDRVSLLMGSSSSRAAAFNSSPTHIISGGHKSLSAMPAADFAAAAAAAFANALKNGTGGGSIINVQQQQHNNDDNNQNADAYSSNGNQSHLHASTTSNRLLMSGSHSVINFHLQSSGSANPLLAGRHPYQTAQQQSMNGGGLVVLSSSLSHQQQGGAGAAAHNAGNSTTANFLSMVAGIESGVFTPNPTPSLVPFEGGAEPQQQQGVAERSSSNKRSSNNTSQEAAAQPTTTNPVGSTTVSNTMTNKNHTIAGGGSSAANTELQIAVPGPSSLRKNPLPHAVSSSLKASTSSLDATGTTVTSPNGKDVGGDQQSQSTPRSSHTENECYSSSDNGTVSKNRPHEAKAGSGTAESDTSSGKKMSKNVKKAQTDRNKSLLLLFCAAFISLVAATGSGVFLYVVSLSNLKKQAADKGAAVVGSTLAQLEGYREAMVDASESLIKYVDAVKPNTTTPDSAVASLNRSIYTQWTSRVTQESEMYGWALSFLYPKLNLNNYSVPDGNGGFTDVEGYIPPQDLEVQTFDGCPYFCSQRESDPVFTKVAKLEIWYDVMQDREREYVYSALRPDSDGQWNDAWSLRTETSPSDETTRLVFNEYLYPLSPVQRNRNGSYTGGLWAAPSLWTSADGTSYYFIGYDRMWIRDTDGSFDAEHNHTRPHQAVVTSVFDRVERWFRPVANIIAADSTDEFMLLTDGKGKVLAFSGHANGDPRLANCSSAFLSSSANLKSCDGLTAVDYPNSFVRDVYNEHGPSKINSATAATEAEWVSIGGKSYLLINQEAFDSGRLRIVATYAVAQSYAIGSLVQNTIIIVLVSVSIILVSSTILIIIGAVAVREQAKTIAVVSKLTRFVSRYDVDGAQRYIDDDENGIGNELLKNEFQQILNNLRAYQSFLPRNLQAGGGRSAGLGVNLADLSATGANFNDAFNDYFVGVATGSTSVFGSAGVGAGETHDRDVSLMASLSLQQLFTGKSVDGASNNTAASRRSKSLNPLVASGAADTPTSPSGSSEESGDNKKKADDEATLNSSDPNTVRDEDVSGDEGEVDMGEDSPDVNRGQRPSDENKKKSNATTIVRVDPKTGQQVKLRKRKSSAPVMGVAIDDEDEGENDIREDDRNGLNNEGRVFAAHRLTSQKLRIVRGSIMIVDYGNLSTADPVEAAANINSFIAIAIPIIEKFGGVVDLMQANQLLVTFNYHSPVVKHEDIASKCALVVRTALNVDGSAVASPKNAAANSQQQQHSNSNSPSTDLGAFTFLGPFANITIAIASGPNIVGTVGTDSTQKSRVVTGEGVDLAKKLINLQRVLGSNHSSQHAEVGKDAKTGSGGKKKEPTDIGGVLISESTMEKCSLLAIPVDVVSLKWLQAGRQRQIAVFELVGIGVGFQKKDPPAWAKGILSGFQLMRRRRYENAIAHFEPAVNSNIRQAVRLSAICHRYVKLREQKLLASRPAPSPSSSPPVGALDILRLIGGGEVGITTTDYSSSTDASSSRAPNKSQQQQAAKTSSSTKGGNSSTKTEVSKTDPAIVYERHETHFEQFEDEMKAICDAAARRRATEASKEQQQQMADTAASTTLVATAAASTTNPSQSATALLSSTTAATATNHYPLNASDKFLSVSGGGGGAHTNDHHEGGFLQLNSSSMNSNLLSPKRTPSNVNQMKGGSGAQSWRFSHSNGMIVDALTPGRGSGAGTSGEMDAIRDRLRLQATAVANGNNSNTVDANTTTNALSSNNQSHSNTHMPQSQQPSTASAFPSSRGVRFTTDTVDNSSAHAPRLSSRSKRESGQIHPSILQQPIINIPAAALEERVGAEEDMLFSIFVPQGQQTEAELERERQLGMSNLATNPNSNDTANGGSNVRAVETNGVESKKKVDEHTAQVQTAAIVGIAPEANTHGPSLFDFAGSDDEDGDKGRGSGDKKQDAAHDGDDDDDEGSGLALFAIDLGVVDEAGNAAYIASNVYDQTTVGYNVNSMMDEDSISTTDSAMRHHPHAHHHHPFAATSSPHNGFSTSDGFHHPSRIQQHNHHPAPTHRHHSHADLIEPYEMPLHFTDINGELYTRSRTILGRGAFGFVTTAMDDDGTIVAVKTMSLEGIRANNVGESAEAAVRARTDALVHEVTVLAEVRHANIAGYVSAAILPSHFCIIMEYLSGGSLRTLISPSHYSRIPTRPLTNYLKGMLRGLQYLHETHNYVHCDVKPDNVMLTSDGTCKLTDFGTAVLMKREEEELQHSNNTNTYNQEGSGWRDSTLSTGGAMTMMDSVSGGGIMSSAAALGAGGLFAASIRGDGGGGGADNVRGGHRKSSGGNAAENNNSNTNYNKNSGDNTPDNGPLIRGTPRYMAPEAALGEWTPATDVYSLGITAIELATGQHPWRHVGGSDTSFLMRLAMDKTMKPLIPPRIHDDDDDDDSGSDSPNSFCNSSNNNNKGTAGRVDSVDENNGDAALRQKWLADAVPMDGKLIDFAEMCIRYDPAERPSVQQLLLFLQ